MRQLRTRDCIWKVGSRGDIGRMDARTACGSREVAEGGDEDVRRGPERVAGQPRAKGKRPDHGRGETASCPQTSRVVF